MPSDLESDPTTEYGSLEEELEARRANASAEDDSHEDGAPEGEVEEAHPEPGAEEAEKAPDASQDAEGAEADDSSLTSPSDQSSEDESSVEELRKELDRLRQEEDRWKSTRQAHDRLAHELNQIKQQLGDTPPEEAARALEQQRQSIPRHNPQHPEHAQFQQTLQKYDIYRQQIAAAGRDQDKLERVAEAWDGTFSEQEVQDLRSFEREQQEFQRRLSMNPQETLRDLVRRESGQLLQETSTRAQREAEAKRLVTDPENWPIIDQKLDRWKELCHQGIEPSRVLEILKVEHERDELRKKLVDGDRKAASAQAQRRLAQGRARNEQDISPAEEVDVYQLALDEAKEQGVTEGSVQFIKILSRLQEQHNL